MKRLEFQVHRHNMEPKTVQGWASCHPDFALHGSARYGWEVTHLASGYKSSPPGYGLDTRAQADAYVARLTGTPELRAIWARVTPSSSIGEPEPFTPDEIALLRPTIYARRAA